MKQLVLVLLVALAANGALAGEVGALNPQLATVNFTTLDVAIAETGTSTGWAIEPFNSMATAHQVADLKNRVELINSTVNSDLEAAIELLLEQSLQY